MSDLGNKKIMAANIKRYMERKGVDSKRVCEDLNIPASTFSNWLNGKIYPRIDKIEILSNYFGISKSDLVERPKRPTFIYTVSDYDERYLIDVFRCSDIQHQAILIKFLKLLCEAQKLDIKMLSDDLF